MIILDSATSVLRARLSAAPVTTNPVFVFAYGDEPLSSARATHNSSGVLNGSTNVSLVVSPLAGVSRIIKSGFIYNADSAAVTLKIEFFDGANARQVGSYLLGPGATLTFSDNGFSSSSAPQGQLAGINDQTGTAYILALTDAGKDVRCTNTSAILLTVPPNSSVPFAIGTMIVFSQGAAGAITVVGGSGVVINAANGSATTAPYDARVLEKVGTDTWRVW